MKVLDANNEEIDLKQTFDNDDVVPLHIPEEETLREETVVDGLSGFALEDEAGEAIEDDELYEQDNEAELEDDVILNDDEM